MDKGPGADARVATQDGRFAMIEDARVEMGMEPIHEGKYDPSLRKG